MFHELTELVVALAGSPWVLVVVFGLIVVDGVFPPIPSEASVLALASLSRQPDTVSIWAVMLVAAVGAFVGDLLAFTLGRRVPIRRLPFLRGGRGAAMVDWADDALRHRGAAFLLAARYVPIGRVVANLTAGALGYPRPRYLAVTAIGAVGWSLWTTMLGLGAGHVLADRPLLAALVGAVAGLIIGIVLDRVITAVIGRPSNVPATDVPATDVPAATTAVIPGPTPATEEDGASTVSN